MTITPSSPKDLERIGNMPFPFRQNADNGRFMVHVSTVERLMVRGWIKALTPEARAYIRAYAKEIAYSFKNKTAPDDPDITDEWLKHLDTKHYTALAFQIMGMERLYRRFVDWGGGCILGDDVGLGKTPQTIGLIGRLRAEGLCRNVLISTTTSTIHQWGDELARMAKPKLKVIPITGTRDERHLKLVEAGDVHIVNHEMIRQEHYREAIHRLLPDVDLIVIDEASGMKNPETVTHLEWFACVQRVKWALPLNATAIENNLSDLWAHVHLVDRHCLGGHAGFESRYVDKDRKKFKRLKEVRKRVALPVYRRTQDNVDLQLPRVRAQARYVSMGTKQRTAYEKAVRNAVDEERGGAVKMSKLAKVQQAALGELGASAKLDDLHALLNGDLEGERVVLFSRFKECVRTAVDALQDFNPITITGDTPHSVRAMNQRRFSHKHGAGRVLICTEAADRGLNLQAAGVVVNLDLPWTAAKLRQRVGRINRVSQHRESILIINYVIQHPRGGTIDEYMMGKIIPKRQLFRDVLGDADIDELGDEEIDEQAITKYIAQVLGKKRRRSA